MKLLICILAFLSIVSARYTNYPAKLIEIDEHPSFYAIEIPYCKTYFCKLYRNDDTLTVKSTSNFHLQKTWQFKDVQLANTKFRDTFNGMVVFIPKLQKKITKPVEIESTYKSPGIEIVDVHEQPKEYTKNYDAVSGYYNIRGKWINY